MNKIMNAQDFVVIARGKLDLTQQELADELGVDRRTVARWEYGESTPGFDSLSGIIRLLGFEIETLL